VGEDFPQDFRRLLGTRPIDLAGLETRQGGKTFRWSGQFEGDMNEAKTLNVDLNVLAQAPPTVPEVFRDSEIVFLANTHPALQKALLEQLTDPQTVVLDTMNLWINNEREALIEVLGMVTGVIINDAEARALTETVNLIAVAEKILALGPRFVIIKKGEHGSLLMSSAGPTVLPAFATKEVRDPTGAGDSFAGGVMGYLCSVGRDDNEALRRAVVRGTIAASFTIEDFSLGRVKDLTRQEIDARVEQFLAMLRIE